MNRFSLESLEPRVLLSAEPMGTMAAAVDPQLSAFQQQVHIESPVDLTVFPGAGVDILSELDELDLSPFDGFEERPDSESANDLHLDVGNPIAAPDGIAIGVADTLSGNGTIEADVVSRGIVSPGNSPGIINIVGDFTFDRSGTLVIEIGGTTAGPNTSTLDPTPENGPLNPTGSPDNGFDQVNITGMAILGGELRIEMLNGFVPALGAEFDVLTFAGGYQGDFDLFEGMVIPGGGGRFFRPVYNADTLTLRVVNNAMDQPLIYVPGFAGSFPADYSAAGMKTWLLNLGPHPDSLLLEPLKNNYSDLLQSLVNIGYTRGVDLFTALWDWRVPVAPQDSVADGIIANATTNLDSNSPNWQAADSSILATNITDNIFETGLDYLGHFLVRAVDAWTDLSKSTVDLAIDMITHSTGGLIARSYLQSAAYGGAYTVSDGAGTQTRSLPTIDHLVQVGVPNAGVSTPFIFLENDFSQDASTRIFGLILDQAADLVLAGTDAGPVMIHDARGHILINKADLISQPADWFPGAYIQPFNDLLTTLSFLDIGGAGGVIAAGNNRFLLDLNGGANANAFIAATSSTTIVYSTALETPDRVISKTGPDPSAGLSGEILPASELIGHFADEGETWFLNDASTAANGDGTIPRQSAIGNFLAGNGSALPIPGLTLVQASSDASPAGAGITVLNAGEPVDHTDLLFNRPAQEAIIEAATGIAVTQAQLSQSRKQGTLEAAQLLMDAGIVVIADLAAAILERLPALGIDLDGAVQEEIDDLFDLALAALTDLFGADVDLEWTLDLPGHGTVTLAYEAGLSLSLTADLAFAVRQFVYASGTITIRKSIQPVPVDIVPHLPGNIVDLIRGGGDLLGGLTGLDEFFDAFPIGLDGVIRNVPMSTIEIGVADANGFIGVSGPYWTDLDGNDTKSWTDPAGNPVPAGTVITVDSEQYGDLNNNGIVESDETGELNEDAVGLSVADLDLGFVLMTPSRIIFPTLRRTLPSFFAMKGTVGGAGLVGLEEHIQAFADNLLIEVNGATGWRGGLGFPVVDFAQSFPANGSVPAGLQVPTGDQPVILDFDGNPRLGAAAERMTWQLDQFVYLVGSFSFEAGPLHRVTVSTGFPGILTGLLPDFLADALNALTGDDPQAAKISSDYKKIDNLEVAALQIGASDVHAFIGLGGPYWTGDVDGDRRIDEHAEDLNGNSALDVGEDRDGDGNLDVSEIDPDAMGYVIDDLNAGFVMMTPTLKALPMLRKKMPKFYALKAKASSIRFVGMEFLTLRQDDIEVHVNFGDKWPGGLGPPVVDFESSFPAADRDGNGTVDPLGYEVRTGSAGPNASIFIDFDGTSRIGASIRKVEFQLSEFVHVTGSVAVEYMPIFQAPLAGGALAKIIDLIPTDVVLTDENGDGLPDSKTVKAMTIGAANVHAFVGINGPYWTDDLDGDSQIDANEINDEAVGLVVDDFDFGLALMKANSPIDKSKYVALHASAKSISLKGIPEVTAKVEDLLVQVNLSSPTVLGVALLPVVDFSKVDLDNDGAADGFYPIRTGAVTTNSATGEEEDVTINLTMNSSLIRAEGYMELDVAGFITLSGSLAFELGPRHEVVLTNGDKVNVTTLTIGAGNITAFIGKDGPYWTDRDGDHQVDEATELNPDSVGLYITKLDAAIVAMASISPDPTELGAFLAIDVSVHEFGFVGVDGLTIQGTFDVQMNRRLKGIGLSTVNFQASFPEITGANAKPAGFRVNTGPQSDPILIDYTGPLISIQAAAKIRYEDDFLLQGVFLFQADSDGLKLFAAAELKFGEDIDRTEDTFFEIDILAVLIIDRDGVAGDFAVNLNLGGVTDIEKDPGVVFDARVIFNTTGLRKQVVIPDKYVDYLEGADDSGVSQEFKDDVATRGVGGLTGDLVDRLRPCDPSDPNSALCYVVEGSAPSLSDIDDNFNVSIQQPTAPGPYLLVFVRGGIRISADWGLSGKFGFVASPGAFEMTVDARLGLGALGSASVKGDLVINSSGAVGRLLAFGNLGSEAIGITFNILGGFELNTTGVNQTIGALTIRPGLRILVEVDFDFLGFATGRGELSVVNEGGDFHLFIDGTLTVGPLSFSLTAYIGILESAGGVADGVVVDAAVSFDVDLLSLFHLDFSGRLRMNTSGRSIASYQKATLDEITGNITTATVAFPTALAPASFKLTLSGSLSVLGIIDLSGGIVIEVRNYAWEIRVPQSNPISASIFGRITIAGYGFVRSDGTYDLTLTGSVTLGTSNTGINGYATIRASFDGSNFAFSIGGGFSATFEGINLFGVNATGSVSGRLGQVVEFRVAVEGTGTFFEIVNEIITVTVDEAEKLGYAIVNFLGNLGNTIVNFFSGNSVEYVEVVRPVRKQKFKFTSFEIPIATIQLPSSTQQPTVQPPPPALAGSLLNPTLFSGGELYLNVGSRGIHRNAANTIANEEYTITHIGGVKGNETVRVYFLNKVETFTGVSKIVADFGDGNDSLDVQGVLADVEARGGPGSDSMLVRAGGITKLFGDAGNDQLTVGGNPVSATEIHGGDGNDSLINESAIGIALHGDGGDDILLGGAGNDSLLGGAGNDQLDGGAGTDTVLGEAGFDLLLISANQLGSGELYDGGPNTDQLEISGTPGNDHFQVSVADAAHARIQLAGGHILTTSVEDLTLDGSQGADTFDIAGAVNDSGLVGITLVLGSQVDTDVVNIDFSALADQVSLVGTGNPVTGGTGVENLNVTWIDHLSILIARPRMSHGDRLTIDGGNGDDFVRVAAIETLPLASLDVSGGGDSDRLGVAGGMETSVWSVTENNGGAVNDRLDFSGFEHLMGGDGPDQFQFADQTGIGGSITGGEQAGGDDVLDFSNYSTAVEVNRQSRTATNVGQFDGIEAAIGGASALDTLIGTNRGSTWLISNANSGSIVGDGPFSFSRFENLTGGRGDDEFRLSTPAGLITGRIEGSVGNDAIDLGVITRDLTFNVTQDNGGTVHGLSSSFPFAAVENLTSGSGNDRFIFADQARIPGHIDARSGTADRLDYGAWTAPVGINLATGRNLGGTVASIEHVFGGSGNDTITGDSGPNLLGGGSGNDGITGFGGNDIILGDGTPAMVSVLGSMIAVIDAGSSVSTGADVIIAGDSGDIIGGGGGDDAIDAGSGNNLIFGDNARIVFVDGAVDSARSIDSANAGNDTIRSGSGIDIIHTGSGLNVVYSGDGADDVTGGVDDDELHGEGGDDFIAGGLGDDKLLGGTGNDVLFGGLAFGLRNDYDRAVSANFGLPSDLQMTESQYSSNPANFGRRPAANEPNQYYPAVLVVPVLVGGASIDGVVADGNDRLQGGGGFDILFGGADSDELFGEDDADYLDAGAGSDIRVDGGAGDDVIRGGAGHDVIDGGSGIDQLYGDSGDDRIFGGPGAADSRQAGQRLFGGDGDDELFAHAPTDNVASEATLAGDQLFGGFGNDNLRGNIRRDLLVGGAGNDFIHGDILRGPDLLPNTEADTSGGNDLIFGDGGDDQLFGGGGGDEIWGGADTDFLEGQEGSDRLYGGSGIDLFIVGTKLGIDAHLDSGSDTVDGHFGNQAEGDVPDDNATDILVIDGTNNHDQILLSETEAGQLRIDIKAWTTEIMWEAVPSGDSPASPDFSGSIAINWRALEESPGGGSSAAAGSHTGRPAIEQFQIAGLMGNDQIGFTEGDNRVDLGDVIERSRDFVGVFDGNSGNDYLIGGGARDRLDGGRGSDVLFGFGGDDRLWGDGGDGAAIDHDIIYAGQGNDDVIGGQGTNELFSWSKDPRNGQAFGIFTDENGTLYDDDGGGLYDLENTGLNRILGNHRDDKLYGGTGIDFLYGNGGNDVFFRADGSQFDSLDGGLAGEAWKEYAKESDQVWYVGATNADDEITLDFVTEPGLLADHHLITRLTNNNGNFSFAAQVRLDFQATDSQGNRIWDAEDRILDLNNLLAAGNDEQRKDALTNLEMAQTDLVNNLLPPDGDFLVIIIDALDGDDQIRVGPTVQKTVWIDAGAGDDRVEIRSGNAILVDKAEAATPNGGFRGRNDSAAQAFQLDVPASGVRFDGLTIDNPEDTDWFRFSLPTIAGVAINLVTASPADSVTLSFYEPRRAEDDAVPPVLSVTMSHNGSLTGLATGREYLLELKTDRRPTIYGIAFAVPGATPGVVDLSLRTDEIRRDVILGGPGNDVLMGGAGEDWIFGGPGNDVLTGGLDRNASDLLIGGDGDDTFQIIPDDLPLLGNQPNTVFDPATETYIPTFSEQLFGGAGNDRVLFLGGDLDRRGFPVPDYAAIRYNANLHRYEFTSLVWDIGLQKFIADSGFFLQQYLFYQTHDVENTQIHTQLGNDVVHADPGFRFLPVVNVGGQIQVDPAANVNLFSEWGIDLGDFEQGAQEAALTIHGGGGNDYLFGGAYADTINGGPGNDLIAGGLGDDELFGDGGGDTIFGAHSGANDDIFPHPFSSSAAVQGPAEPYRYQLAQPSIGIETDTRAPGIDLSDPNLPDSISLDDAFGLQSDGEALSRLQKIGDFNYDGFDDFIVTGENFSYILFRPSTLDDMEDVAENAEIVVDRAVFGTPAQRFGDVNGDGVADLAFSRVDDAFTVITLVFGQDINWPRDWDENVLSTYLNETNRRTIRLPNEDGIIVRQIKSAGVVSSLTAADALLALPGGDPGIQSEATVRAPFINFRGTGGDGRFGDNQAFPGGDGDDFVIHAVGTFYIPTSGTWTFGTNSDDGVRLRIDGDLVINDNTQHGPMDRFGQRHLTAGVHRFELVFFERNSGAEIELFAAPGSHTAFDSQFRLLGAPLRNEVAVFLSPIIDNDTGAANPDDDVVILRPGTTGHASVVTGTYDLGDVFSGRRVLEFVPTPNHPHLTLGDRYANISALDPLPDLQSIIAGDVNADGIEEILFGLANNSQTITVNAVIPAEIVAQAAAQVFPGFSSNLTIQLGPLTNTFAIHHVDWNQDGTTNVNDLVDQINAKILASNLAHRVTASLKNTRITLTTDESGVQLTVSETVNSRPLGFDLGGLRNTESNYNITDELRNPVTNEVIGPKTVQRFENGLVAISGQRVPQNIPGVTSRITIQYLENLPTQTDRDELEGFGFNFPDDLLILQSGSGTIDIVHGSTIGETIERINQAIALVRRSYSTQTTTELSSTNSRTFYARIGVSGIDTIRSGSPFPIDMKLLGEFEGITSNEVRSRVYTPTGKTNGLSVINMSNSPQSELELGTYSLNGLQSRDINGDWLLETTFLINSSNPPLTEIDLANIQFDVPFAVARIPGGGGDGPILLQVVNFPQFHEGLVFSVSEEQVLTRPLGFTSQVAATRTGVGLDSFATPILGALPSGHGRLQVTLDASSPVMAAPLALGDINNDGYDDFGFSTASGVNVYFGGANLPNTAGAPDLRIDSTGFAIEALAAGDLDGDGRTDLAAVAPYDQSILEQWASSVVAFSSQLDPDLWAATQVLGPPNTLTYEDLPTAWAPSPANGSQEFIKVGFGTAVYATGVMVRETLGNGFVTRVDLIDVNGQSHTVWMGTDPSQPGAPADFQIDFPETAYKVAAVTIHIDTNHDLSSWEEIDAIQLQGVLTPSSSGLAVLIVRDVASTGSTLSLQDADIVLRRDDSEVGLPWFVNPALNLDFNADGIDDLLVMSGGRIHAVYGSPVRVALPQVYDVLENRSIPGSGSFVVDRGTGRPEIFPDGADPYRFEELNTDQWFQFSTLGDGQPGDAIRILSAGGADDVSLVGDLIDKDGRVVYTEQAAFDLRAVEAGTYYLRVQATGAFGASYTIAFDAPASGATHETSILPDRDRIDGGDGDDTMYGNYDIDSLSGRSGADVFIGEAIEVRDNTPGDLRSDPVLAENSTQTPPVVLDPVIDIPHEGLRNAIAAALGFPRPLSPSGIAVVVDAFHATDLGSITVLDASGINLGDLTGIEHLLNLRALDLSVNLLYNDNLPALLGGPQGGGPVPARSAGQQAGEPAGLTVLEYLNLNNNPDITDISALAGLTTLRTLRLEGTGVDPMAATTIDTLLALEHLEFLTLPNIILDDGQDLIVAEGETIQRWVPQQYGLWREHYVLAVTDFPDFDSLFPNFTSIDPVVDFHTTPDFFAMRWTGAIFIDTAGVVSFHLRSADGSRLFVDEQLVVDNGGLHGSVEVSADVELTEGFHSIRIEYFESGGAAEVVLRYTPVGGAKQIVPQDVLYVTEPLSWHVKDASGAVIAIGTGTPIEFMPPDAGIYLFFAGAEAFLVIVKNVTPDIVQTSDFSNANGGTGVNEGQAITVGAGVLHGDEIWYDVRVDGAVVDRLIINDPGVNNLGDLEIIVTITTPGGGVTDLVTGSQSVPFIPVDEGTYWFTVTVSDGNGGGDSSRALFTVNNVAPIPNLVIRDETNFSLLFGAGISILSTNLTVNQDPVLFHTETFETGALDGRWTTSSSSAAGRIRVTGSPSTGGGLNALLMDAPPQDPGNPEFVLNEAVWTVDLSGPVDYGLYFSHADFQDAETPFAGPFTGSFNADGIAISVDGVNWHPIFNAPNALFPGFWGTVSINLAAKAAEAGITLTADTRIKFQHYGNSALPTDGRGYDEIRIGAFGQTTSSGATFETWVYPTNGPQLFETLINTNNAGEDWALYHDSTFWWYRNGLRPVNTGIPVEFGEWQHVAVAFDPASGVRFFRNGVERYSNPEIGGYDFATLPLTVGSSFGGWIDDVRVWGRPLSAAEIQAGLAGVAADSPGLIGYWPFNEGFGTTTADLSPNGNTGTLANFAGTPLSWSSGRPLDAGSGNIAGTIGGELTFDASGTTDPGANDRIRFLWELTTTNGQAVRTSTKPVFRFTPEFPGMYTVTLTTTDSDGGVSIRTQTVTVKPAAQIRSSATGTIAKGDLVIFESSESSHPAPPGTLRGDTRSGTRTYHWTAMLAGQTVATGNTATFPFVPSAPGNYTIKLAITDTFADTLNVGNDIELNSTEVRTEITVLDSSRTITVREGLPGTVGVELTLGVSGLGNFAQTMPGTAGADVTRRFEWRVNSAVIAGAVDAVFRHTPAAAGNLTIGLTIRETVAHPEGGTYETTWIADDITVAVRNPVLEDVVISGPQAVVEGASVDLRVQRVDSTPISTDDFTVLWTVAADNGQIVADGSAANFSFVPNDNGVYQVTVTVKDSDDRELVQTAVVTVTNAPPAGVTINPLAADPIHQGDVVSLSAAFTDAGGNDTHTFLWQIAAANWQFIPVGQGATFDFTPNDDGMYTVTLTITDDDRGASNVSVDIMVENRAPTFADAAFRVNDNAPARTAIGAVAATDPDTVETFVYEIIGGNDGGIFAIDRVTGEITVANGNLLNFAATPVHSLTVRVTDSGGLSDTATVTINVNAAPFENLSTPLADVAVNEDAVAPATITLSDHVSDPNSDVLNFQILNNSNGVLVSAVITGDQLAVSFLAGPNGTQSGSAVLTIRATDSGGAFIDVELKITVYPIYHPSDRNKDWEIDLNELNAFTQAWLRGNAWGWDNSIILDAADPDFMNYLTAAIALWRDAGTYHRVGGAGPSTPTSWAPTVPPTGGGRSVEAVEEIQQGRDNVGGGSIPRPELSLEESPPGGAFHPGGHAAHIVLGYRADLSDIYKKLFEGLLEEKEL